MSEARGAGYSGQAGTANGNGRLNSTAFLVKQLQALVRTAALVRVTAVYGGGLAGIGRVDVKQLVNLIDGIGNGSDASEIFELPFARVQGGANAVICDPVVGDIGVAVFADRDISVVKANDGAQSVPGSRRSHNASDGLYLFSVMGYGPTQYVEFTDDGIDIVDKNSNTIVMDASGITINGVLFNRTSDVSGIAKLTSTDDTSLGGGSQPVKLADGTASTKVKAT